MNSGLTVHGYRKNKELIEDGYITEHGFIKQLQWFKDLSSCVEGSEPTLDWCIKYFKDRTDQVDKIRKESELSVYSLKTFTFSKDEFTQEDFEICHRALAEHYKNKHTKTGE
jgi:hypothetical protein